MDASAIPDDSVCYICDKPGLLNACDRPGCNKTMHWYHNDPDHQPTSDNYYCTDCRKELGIPHPPHAALHHECVVCFISKPADQFVKALPECQCAAKNNRACAACAYKIVDHADADLSSCKCPTCCLPFTQFVLPATANAPQQVISLNYQPVNEVAEDDQEEDEDMAYIMSHITGDEVVAAAPAPAPAPATVVAPAAAPAALAVDPFGAFPVLPAPGEHDDGNDDDNDPDYVPDTGSIVGDVAPPGRLDDEPASKRRTGPSKERVVIVRKEDLPSAGQLPHKNPKKDSGYRIAGTLPDLITDAGHQLSTYDSDSHRNRFFTEATKGFDGDDLLDPMETDPDAVSAHCFVLMFRSGYKVGETGSSSLTKHHKRIRALMTIERGITDKSKFKHSFKASAEEVANRVATKDKANSPGLNTPLRVIVKNYMSAFNCYCKMLLDEQAGKINGKLP
jgi:hypothetical protein